MKFYLNELNIKADGTNDVAVYVKEDEVSAMKLFYQKCASNIDSNLYQHSLIMVTRQDGVVMAVNEFKHEVE